MATTRKKIEKAPIEKALTLDEVERFKLGSIG